MQYPKFKVVKFLTGLTVHLSPTFYAWLFQYVGKMTVVAPAHVRQHYAEKLRDAMDEALGT